MSSVLLSLSLRNWVITDFLQIIDACPTYSNVMHLLFLFLLSDLLV